MTVDNAAAEKAFLDGLVKHRLLIPSGVPGIFGRGTTFEDVLQSFDRFVTASAAGDGAELLRFPPVINRKDFERSEFLKSFPQLAGSVFSFEGTHDEHMELLGRVHDGRDWSSLQKMTDVVLAPAACYPVYPMVSGTIPAGGHMFDVFSYCFRHEPSGDPARMQSFRMHEYVRVGEEAQVVAFRDMWLERGLGMLRALGLPVGSDVASDPFFGRGGRMLAANQREQKLKFEVLIPICSTERPTAIMSANYHQDHFGTIFGIKTPSGGVAHTACMGFGMERVTLALFKTHGFRPAEWPADVRKILWP